MIRESLAPDSRFAMAVVSAQSGTSSQWRADTSGFAEWTPSATAGAPQWVRVVGGFTEHQFAEKRLPTIEELNAVAPDTPVFLLHLYDRAVLNGAALRAVGYTRDTPAPQSPNRVGLA